MIGVVAMVVSCVCVLTVVHTLRVLQAETKSLLDLVESEAAAAGDS